MFTYNGNTLFLVSENTKYFCAKLTVDPSLTVCALTDLFLLFIDSTDDAADRWYM